MFAGLRQQRFRDFHESHTPKNEKTTLSAWPGYRWICDRRTRQGRAGGGFAIVPKGDRATRPRAHTCFRLAVAWPHQVKHPSAAGRSLVGRIGIGQGFSCSSSVTRPAKIAVIVSGPAPFFSSPSPARLGHRHFPNPGQTTKKQLTKDWDGHAHLECPKIRLLVL